MRQLISTTDKLLAAGKLNFYDARNSQVGNMIAPFSDALNMETVSAYLSRKRFGATTNYFFSQNTHRTLRADIFFGPAYFSGDARYSDSLYVHELLHAATSLNDADLAEKLGVNPGSDASKAIQSWIENGCK